MKLASGDAAMVDIDKLRGYCLDPEHPRGRHKARVFRSVLGLTESSAEEIRLFLLDAAQTVDAIPYGTG